MNRHYGIPKLRAVLAMLLLCSTAQAGRVEIAFTGLDLQYDGTSFYDAGTHNSVGSGNPAEADALTSMSFYLDGSLVGVQSTDIFADIYLRNVLNLPATGGVVNGIGGGFGIDLLTQNQLPGWGLKMYVDSFQVFYSGSQLAISASGLIGTSQLPFGLSYDPSEPITFVLWSESLSGVTADGGFLTGLNSSGNGNNFRWEPEPGSVVLSAFGLIALVTIGLRRRRPTA
jgi:hypothetical protein